MNFISISDTAEKLHESEVLPHLLISQQLLTEGFWKAGASFLHCRHDDFIFKILYFLSSFFLCSGSENLEQPWGKSTLFENLFIGRYPNPYCFLQINIHYNVYKIVWKYSKKCSIILR